LKIFFATSDFLVVEVVVFLAVVDMMITVNEFILSLVVNFLALLKFSFWATSSCELFSFKSIVPSKELAKLNVANIKKIANI
jgi:hypothetical protein